jgi:hypothetical protein
MMTRRLLPVSGIAFVALVVVALLVGGSTPGSDEPTAQVTAFYDENQVRQFIVCFLFAATVPFLVLFAVSVARVEDGTWGQVTVAGAILAGSSILATAAIHFALLDAADGGVANEAISALNALDGSTWVAFNAGFGVLMLRAAGVLLRASVLRCLGWIALVLGIAAFVPVADFFALLGTLLWIAVAGIMLARRTRETAFVAAPDPA